MLLRTQAIERWVDSHCRTLAILLAIAVTVSTAYFGPRAVGGADEYGYASQADLWLTGSLTIDQGFVRRVPWSFAERTFAPLGYHPHPHDRGRLVPTYSPGFPLLLAAAKGIGGQDSMFFVVPIAAGLLVLGTFSIGRRLGARGAALSAAWLIATSPTVLFMSTATMSDVPVAAVWAWAFYLLFGRTTASAAGSGLLSSLAILIRPNLAPLAGVLAFRYVLELRDRDRRGAASRQLAVFSIALVPAILCIAILNDRLHGSAWTSGYGALSELFALSRVPANVRLYVGWLIESHTWIVLAGVVAVFVPLQRIRPRHETAGDAIVIALFVAGVWSIYCAWLIFDVWWFTRFMLSSWPFIMLGTASVASAAYRSAGPYVRPFVAGGLIALGLYQLYFADQWRVFSSGDGRRRFVAAARLVRSQTDPNSVIVSNDHNGSIRYYGGRMTLDFEWLPRGPALDASIDWLRAHGVHTYAAIEEWEIDRLRQRLAGSRVLAALDRPPVAIYEQPGRMLLFDLADPRPVEARPVVERDTRIGWRAVPPVAPPTLVIHEEGAAAR